MDAFGSGLENESCWIAVPFPCQDCLSIPENMISFVAVIGISDEII